jgi:RND family efflux transporter MFP subunit
MKGKLIYLSLAATTGVVVAGALGCGRGEASPAAGVPLVPVAVSEVSLVSAVQTILAAGTLGAKEELPLAFKIGGIVARVAVDAGQAVRAGSVLAELAPTEIAAEVEKARQGRAKAERDLARVKSLYRDSVATLEQLQDATTQFEVAASNLKIAEFNRQYSVIRAGTDGVILKRMVEPGQLVSPGATVLLFRTDRRGVVLRAALPDRDAVTVRIGDTASVRFDAYPGERFRGRVAQIAAAATQGTGTYEVEIALEGRGSGLVSGLVGHVAIAPRSSSLVPSVPVEALLEAHGDSATLFTLSDDSTTVTRRRVRVGPLDGARVTVLDGLAGGQRVVTAGAEWLADGVKVRLVTVPVAKGSR